MNNGVLTFNLIGGGSRKVVIYRCSRDERKRVCSCNTSEEAISYIGEIRAREARQAAEQKLIETLN